MATNLNDGDALKRIGGAMKEARRAAGRSQASVAETIGTKQPQICRWENGKANFGVVQLLRYADACRVRPERLVEGIIEPTVEQMRLKLDPVAGEFVNDLVQLLHDRPPRSENGQARTSAQPNAAEG